MGKNYPNVKPPFTKELHYSIIQVLSENQTPIMFG